MSSRVAILIGNSRSAGAAELEDLQGPPNDVHELAPILSDPALGGFDVHAVIDTTTSETIDAIEEGFRQAGRGGLLLLYYCGWGVLDDNGRLHLTTTDSRLANLSTTAISEKFLRDLLEHSVCEQAVVILDCCFTGATGGPTLIMKVRDELRRLHAKGGATVAVIASSPRVQSPEDREDDQGGRRGGTLTRLLAEGLRSGAADQDGDGHVTVGNLGEFLSVRMPTLCPTWLADPAGDALVVANCPEPMPGSVAGKESASIGPRAWLPGRNWALFLALLCLAAVIVTVSSWNTVGSGSPRLAPELHRDDLESLDIRLAGLVREHLLMRQLAANAAWVEHPIDSWRVLDNYPGAVSVSSRSREAVASGRLLVPHRGEMDMEMTDGTHGIGILCRQRMNIASVLVRLADGEELRFEIEAHLAADVFYGFLSPVPIEHVHLEGTRGSLEIERLYFYTDREHPLVEGG